MYMLQALGKEYMKNMAAKTAAGAVAPIMGVCIWGFVKMVDSKLKEDIRRRYDEREDAEIIRALEGQLISRASLREWISDSYKSVEEYIVGK